MFFFTQKQRPEIKPNAKRVTDKAKEKNKQTNHWANSAYRYELIGRCDFKLMLINLQFVIPHAQFHSANKHGNSYYRRKERKENQQRTQNQTIFFVVHCRVINTKMWIFCQKINVVYKIIVNWNDFFKSDF